MYVGYDSRLEKETKSLEIKGKVIINSVGVKAIIHTKKVLIHDHPH